jgi:hypothetical protein
MNNDSSGGLMNKKENINNGCDSESCKPIEVPTEDELVALNAMRTIKDRSKDVKKRLSEISFLNGDENAEKILELEREMEQLKAEWREWEEKRKDATRHRMILLGHEEP